MARLQAPPPTPGELVEVETALAAWEAEAEARDRELLVRRKGQAGVVKRLVLWWVGLVGWVGVCGFVDGEGSYV